MKIVLSINGTQVNEYECGDLSYDTILIQNGSWDQM